MNVFYLLMMLSTANATATEVRWIHLNVNHSYEDISTDCYSYRPGGDLYFASEIEGGKPTRVVLSNVPYVWPFTYIYRSVELTLEEVRHIEFHRDGKGRYWLKHLPLTSRLLRWILYVPTESNSYCPLPQPLQTISPSWVDYEFETKGIDEGILLSYSPYFSFSGKRSDGHTFKARMQLMQREFKRSQ